MIPCVPSQDLVHLRNLMSPGAWVGNHQDSSDGRSFEKAQGSVTYFVVRREAHGMSGI
jgi:hypothetical protein